MSPTIAHRFADAFHTRDPAAVTAVFAPDAVYQDLFYGAAHGHDRIRALFERMYSEGGRHEWVMTTAASASDVTLAEWRFTFTVADGVRGAGRTLRFAGVSAFACRDGLCHTYREYFDRGAALLAVGVAPEAVARIARRRPTVEVLPAGRADSGP